MMNIIKTAFITIIISVISGLLLEYCKNLAPRILCSIGNGVPVKKNGKKFFYYIVTVRNLSSKTVHKLTLNIQSAESRLKITKTRMTGGLKFTPSIQDNNINIDIPFFSKDDEFSARIYVENEYELCDKPIVTLRSPEKFREVNSGNSTEVSSLFGKNTNNTAPASMKQSKSVPNSDPKTGIARNIKNKAHSKNTFNPKKAVIAMISVIVLIGAGIFVKSYFSGNSNDQNTHVSKNSNSDKTSNNNNNKSTKSENKNSRTTNATQNRTTNGTSSNTSSTSNSNNSDSKSTDSNNNKSTDNSNSKTSSTSSDQNSNSSSGSTNQNSNSNKSSDESTGNSNSSSNGTNGGNSGQNSSSSDSSSQNTGN